MAAVEHADEENSNKPNKITSTVLDNFRRLTHDKEKIRLKSSVALLKHIHENRDTENGKDELKYALGRLIRGLGASKSSSKVGFYTVLVALLSSVDDIDVSDILERCKLELHSSGSNSKSENADISSGQILLYGAVIRTNFFDKATSKEKVFIIEQLLIAGKKRDYLFLSCVTFLIELCGKINDKDFKSIVWPLLKTELEKPWGEQNIDTLHLLYALRDKFPNIVNKKFMQNCIGAEDIYSRNTFQELSQILLNIPRITVSNHPFYEVISQKITLQNLTVDFIEEIDKGLIKYNYNRHYIATIILTNCLKSAEKTDVIPDLLHKNYIQHTLQYFKGVKGSKNPEPLQAAIYNLFNLIVENFKKENADSNTKIKTIRKLLFYPGIFIFEKLTRSKIVQQIISTLDFTGIEKLAELYKGLILGRNEAFIEDEGKQACLNNDKLYASQLLVKLLSHPNANEQIVWKTEQLKFLMRLCLLKNEEGGNISVELAALLKGTFYNGLSQLQLRKLKDLREVLSNLVMEIKNFLNRNHLFRNPLTDEAKEMWLKSQEYIQKLETKHKKIYTVFHTLFLHMSLQLFNDVKLAMDSLKELFSCYERIRSEKKHTEDVNSEDPLWIEVVTDLFLNLLSHKSSLLRSLINYVFPHLCKYLNVTAMHQVLDVLDPKNEENPLISNEDSESEDEEDKAEEEDETDTSEESDNDEEMDDKVNDKLKMAIQNALGGNQSDEESVDLDQMSESEGKQLDDALAAAFKQFKPNIGKKSNKQKKEDEALTHFRVRVLDLIDLYIDSDPSMYLCLEIMVVLLRCLEFAVKDEHQRPLLNRLKASLKKLCNVKKFNSVEDIEESTLPDLLNSLLEKGTKNYFVVQEMNGNICECCLFIVKCTDYLSLEEELPTNFKKHVKKAITGIISECLETYFTKRESFIPYGLFKNIFASTWVGCYKLMPFLLEYVFDDKIKVFKACQALDLVKVFSSNHRLLTTYSETQNLDDYFEKLSENVLKVFTVNENITLKEKYIRDLMTTLMVIKKSPINQEKIEWELIGKNLREFRASVVFKKNTKVSFTKLCKALNIDANVILKKDLIKLGNNDPKESKIEKEGETIKNEKRKKEKVNKLKKETQALRMQSLSEGLSVDFAMGEINNEKLYEEIDDVEMEIDKKTKRKNGDVSEEVRKKKRKKKE